MTDAERPRKFLTRRWLGLAAVAVLLPLLATLVMVWTTQDRRDQLDNIPVAIVNNDTIITDPQPMAAGRALASALMHPADGDPQLDWVLTDEDDAEERLRTGEYYAVLTIPSDFSKAILSTGTDNPESGQVQLTSNAAASQTVPYISKQVVAAATQALGQQSTEAYLKQVYAGFNQIANGQQSAAQSAQQLASGTSELADGADDLESGTSSLAIAVGELATGSAELEQGADSVAAGSVRVQQGTTDLAAGARGLADAGAGLADGAGRLAARADEYADRSAAVARGSSAVARTATRVSGAAGRLAAGLTALSDRCAAAGGSAQFCADLRLARAGSRVVAAGNRLLVRETDALSRAQAGLADGAEALAAGDRGLAAGARRLDDGASRLARSAGELARGAGEVAQGATQLASSSGQLASGAQQAADGADSLVSGSETLASSAGQVDAGAQQLASGLAKGAKQSPTYSKSEQDALAATVSEPVELTATTEHDDAANGFLIGAILGVLLWLAALAGAVLLDVSAAKRFALAPLSSGRIALAEAGPAAVLGLVQGAVVVLALVIGGVSMTSAIGVALMSLLAAVVFSILGYTLRLAGGPIGIAVFVLFLLVQIAALSNVVPLETAPAPLQRLNSLLPLTAYADAVNRLVAGGEVGSIVGPVVVLLGWGLAAVVAVSMIVKRMRVASSPPTLATPPGVGTAPST